MRRIIMQCKKCKSENYVKNGFEKGKQRYKCKVCGCNFTDTPQRGYSWEMRLQALHLYLEGLGFRSIARFLKISNVTVLNWIKAFGASIEYQTAAKVDFMEIDEMHHYVKKKTKSYGSGWLLIELKTKSLDGKQVVVVQKRV